MTSSRRKRLKRKRWQNRRPQRNAAGMVYKMDALMRWIRERYLIGDFFYPRGLIGRSWGHTNTKPLSFASNEEQEK